MARIIVFDSGFGSLSIIKPIQQAVKSEIIYFADQKNFPYGQKSIHELTKIITKRLELLEEQFKPDLIVVGSNTPSLLVHIKKKNVIKVLPPIKMAAKISVTGNVAILATHATIKSKKLSEFIKKSKLPKRIHIKKINTSKLVQLVESVKFIDDKNLCKRTINKVLNQEFSKYNIDVATLSSTHLPFLLSFFNKQFPTVNFLDPGQEVADKVRKTVKKPSKRNSMKIFTSSKPEKFQKDLSKIGIKQKVTFLN
jgi:glutamate racemase|tara:strand:+ start:832 stop:1590 length:759 start_codon:yes stop_codon:yes gene_type:complete